MEYEDFELQIGPRLDEGLLVRVRSPAGDGEALAQLPKLTGDLEQLAGTTRHLIVEAAGLPSAPEEVGSELFRTVFTGQVSDLLQRSLSRVEAAARGLRLRIRINLRDRTMAPLLDWPWELLYRQDTEEFLALSRGTPIVRTLDVPRPSAVRRYRPPLRILAVLARDPEGSPLSLEEELKQLRESLADDPEIQLETLDDPDTQTLRNVLDQKEIHILHYMGHGVFEPAGGEGALLFGGPEGRMPVTGRHLAAKVKDLDALRLVVLNACETAVVAGEAAQGPFAGVAAALVLSGLPAVVAMQSSIMDVHSVAFTAAFYRRLACGMSVEEAVTEGRQAILSQNPESAAWAIPVLFLRSTGDLFAPEPAALRPPSARQESRSFPRWAFLLGLLLVALGLGLADRARLATDPKTSSETSGPATQASPLQPPASPLQPQISPAQPSVSPTSVSSTSTTSPLTTSARTLDRLPDLYRLRVTVLAPDGRPSNDAMVSTSVGGEILKAHQGWEILLPRNRRGQALTVFASHPEAFLQGREEVTLGENFAPPAIEIQLSRREAEVRGTVVDSQGHGVAGAIVSVVGFEQEAVETSASGDFHLPAHAAERQTVRLRVVKDGISNEFEARAGDLPVQQLIWEEP